MPAKKFFQQIRICIRKLRQCERLAEAQMSKI